MYTIVIPATVAAYFPIRPSLVIAPVFCKPT